MNEPLVISDQIVIPARELQFSYSRSGGPGGQNVNKVNTKATLRWPVYQTQALPGAVLNRFAQRFQGRINDSGELVLQSDSHREQLRNTLECRDRLRAMLLAVLHPPKARKKTKPSRASVRRRLESKRQHSAKKQQRRDPEME